jgi:hypothetical protein
MIQNPKFDNDFEDGSDDLEMNRIDQTILLCVSLFALILAIVGFSMSDTLYLFVNR